MGSDFTASVVQEALKHVCPSCAAIAGQPCRRLNRLGAYEFMRQPHARRLYVAVEYVREKPAGTKGAA